MGQCIVTFQLLFLLYLWRMQAVDLWAALPALLLAHPAGKLSIYWPGCRTSPAIDIRTLDRHPLASVGSLVLGLRCSFCPGSAPMLLPRGLHKSPPGSEVARRWLNVAASVSIA
jgi:hypothetical protein